MSAFYTKKQVDERQLGPVWRSTKVVWICMDEIEEGGDLTAEPLPACRILQNLNNIERIDVVVAHLKAKNSTSREPL